MKYQIEYCPNPNCIQIHVDQRLIHGLILSTGFAGEEKFEKEALNPVGLKSFCEVVDKLDGVESDTTVSRYNIQMLKASEMFSWDQIIPHVLEAMKTFLSRNGELEESLPPKHPTPEELHRLKQQMDKVSQFMDDDF